MNKLEQYLNEFKGASSPWFEQQGWFIPRFEFIKNLISQRNRLGIY